MLLNIHKCDLCTKVYDRDKCEEDYPLFTTNDRISTVRVQLGTQRIMLNGHRYVREFDLCPECMQKVLTVLKMY